MEEALKDQRFSHILTDPRFRKMPKSIRKVTVDKRFKGMFKDNNFKGKCMFDKRGRPLDLKPSENLKQLYDVSSESSEDDDGEDRQSKNTKNKNKTLITKPLPRKHPVELSELASDDEIRVPSESNDADNDDEQSKKNRKNKKKTKIANENKQKKKNISDSLINKKFMQLSKPSSNAEIEGVHPESNDDDEYQKSKKNRKNKEDVRKIYASEKKVKAISEKQEQLSSEDDSDEDISENEKGPVKISSKSSQKKNVLNKKETEIANENKKKKKNISDSLINKKFLQLSKPSSNAEIEDVHPESNDDDEYQQSKKNRKNKEDVRKIYASEKKVKAVSEKQEEDSDEDISENEKGPVSSKSSQKKNVLLKKAKSAIEHYRDIKVNDSVQISEDEESGSSDEASDKDSSEESDDSDDSDSDDGSGDISDDFDHQWEELRNEAPDTNEMTKRLAVCNMDWDRIRADDLFACFNSFKPADGSITSVKIYPSEFGLKRIEEERVRGPSELVEETLPLNKEEPEDKKGSKYHREKLRQYQINRLKYFYAVVDCDSPETANVLYEQLNGMEYESSSVRFDLRFIPDNVTFEHEPTSIADKVPDPTEYKPRLFVTAALQQVKVNLTWDETDPKRRETLQKAFTEPESIEKDLKEYLASSSGESEEENEECVEEGPKEKLSSKDRIAKYKQLLLSLEEKEKEEENKYEMEITWEPGLKEKTEELVKGKMKKNNLNPFEEVIQKKKDEKKLKKKEQKAKQLQADDDSASSNEDSAEEFFFKSTSESNLKDQDSKRLAELALISDSRKETHFVEKSNKKSKKFKKNMSKKEDDFKINVNDPRFSAIYSNHLFNIDPSDPHFKDSEGNRALIQEKQRKLKSTGFQDRNRNTKKARYS